VSASAIVLSRPYREYRDGRETGAVCVSGFPAASPLRV